MKSFRLIWKDVREGQHLESYLTILLGLVVSVLGLLAQVEVEVLIAATTALLALLAWGNLSSHRSLQSLDEVSRELLQTVGSVLVQDAQPSTTIRTLVESATHEILILTRIGMTLQEQRLSIAQAIKRGCRVKAVMCSEDEHILKLLASRGRTLKTPDSIRQQMSVSRQAILGMVDDLESPQGQMELRDLPFIPFQSICIVDPDEATAIAFVQLGTFRSSSYRSPALYIRKSQNLELFRFFEQEFENYLQASRTVSSQSDTHP